MDKEKEKEIEQKRQQNDYFKYHCFGYLQPITTHQFIYKLPKLDLQIMGVFLCWNIFYLAVFWDTIFDGLQYFTIFFTIYSLLFGIACLFFSLKINHELEIIDSNVYKIYCFARLAFISLALMGSFGYFIVIQFLYHFFSLNKFHFQFENKFKEHFQNIRLDLFYIMFVNVIYSICVFYSLSHQIFWHAKLDYSWQQNNIGYILRQIDRETLKKDVFKLAKKIQLENRNEEIKDGDKSINE